MLKFIEHFIDSHNFSKTKNNISRKASHKMYLSSSLFVLSFISLSFASKFAADDEMIHRKEEVRYSFKVDVPKGITPVHTKDEQDYITLCLASAFNGIHDPKNYTIEEVDIEDKLITPIPAAELSRTYYDDFYDDDYSYGDDFVDDDNWDDDASWIGPHFVSWYVGYYSAVWSALCRGCGPYMLSSYHHPHDWEQSFNKCLRESSFHDIKKSYDVRIDVVDEKEYLEDIQSDIKVSFATPADALTDEEHNFVMQTLKETYNVLEQNGNNHSMIQAASFVKKASFPVSGDENMKQAVVPLHLRSNPAKWLIHITARINSIGSRFPATMPLDITYIVDWENDLCNKLSVGLFKNLKDISGCKIEIDTSFNDLMITY